jgi:hypothetical protein
VEVFIQALVVMERNQGFFLTQSNQLWVTSLLNIPKLVTFMQSHWMIFFAKKSHWMMLPMIVKIVLRGPKAKKTCRLEATQKMPESDSTTNFGTHFSGSK